ncbi:MAG: hypothetical protein JW395_2998 [Nitrospira sp.]|nr:hypothetical protein [Nitrospira sp.]
MKPPTHGAVLGLICKGKPMEEIQRELKCSRGTVVNRKKRLVAKLGPLERFIETSGWVAEIEKTMRDTGAKTIYKNSLRLARQRFVGLVRSKFRGGPTSLRPCLRSRLASVTRRLALYSWWPRCMTKRWSGVSKMV